MEMVPIERLRMVRLLRKNQNGLEIVRTFLDEPVVLTSLR